MLRRAPLFAAWCAADPASTRVVVGPGSAEQRYTLHRVRDTHSLPFGARKR